MYTVSIKLKPNISVDSTNMDNQIIWLKYDNAQSMTNKAQI